MLPSPTERTAALARCRELLVKPTQWELGEAALVTAQRELLLEMLDTGDPNTRSLRPLPSRWSGCECAECGRAHASG